MDRNKKWAVGLFALVAIVVIGVAVNLGGVAEETQLLSEPKLEVQKLCYWVTAANSDRTREFDAKLETYFKSRLALDRSSLLVFADQQARDLAMNDVDDRTEEDDVYDRLNCMLSTMGMGGMSAHDQDLRQRIEIVASTYRAQQDQIDTIVNR